MPIYEFFCQQCNRIYRFLSRTVNTEKTPHCPKCGDVKLKRQVSLFAAVSGKKDSTDESGMPPIDESKMEQAMTMLAREAGGINENDPRQAAALMRKLSQAAGLKMGASMEEALNRMERGDDPEQIEQEMGDIVGHEEPFTFESGGNRGSRPAPPETDDTLYEL
ncbi:MAG: zinc ribbon domain-containing protein [Nitrospiraceae bacterium]|nr:MAG: zinc ribbon domain-containing protein [Nitrospiraceae bacterium]